MLINSQIEDVINGIYYEASYNYEKTNSIYYKGYADGLDRATIAILELLKKEMNPMPKTNEELLPYLRNLYAEHKNKNSDFYEGYLEALDHIIVLMESFKK